jgi:hypothetical protein
MQPRESTFHCVCKCDGWIEVRTRDRTKCQNQRDKHRTRSNRVREQREGYIPVCQSLCHDPGTHDGGNKEPGANEFSNQAA